MTEKSENQLDNLDVAVCKHTHVKATVEWTEDFRYTLEYVDVDWESEEYENVTNMTDKESVDGSGNRITEIKCLLCGKILDLEEISESMIDVMGEE